MRASDRKWINYVSVTYLFLLVLSSLVWTSFADLYKIPMFIVAYIFPYVFLFAMDQPVLWVTYFIIISIAYIPMLLLYFSAAKGPNEHSGLGKFGGILLVFTWFLLVSIAIIISHAQ
jgi:hypothetical protein